MRGAGTVADPYIISASELRDFTRCRVRWDLRHRQQLEPVGDSRNLAFGGLVALISEAWYKEPPGLRSVKRMTTLAKKMTNVDHRGLSTEDRELVMAMMVGYAEWASEDDKDIGLAKAVANPEEKFELFLTETKRIRVHGKFDVRFKPTNLKRTMAVVEMKTASSFRDQGVENMLQLTTYLWALRQKYPGMLDYVVHYTELRKQMPTARVTAPLFQRQEVSRDDEFITQWALDAEAAVFDMIDPKIYPNPMSNCQFDCDFKNPCLLRGRPGDLKHVLASEFKKKEWRK